MGTAPLSGRSSQERPLGPLTRVWRGGCAGPPTWVRAEQPHREPPQPGLAAACLCSGALPKAQSRGAPGPPVTPPHLQETDTGLLGDLSGLMIWILSLGHLSSLGCDPQSPGLQDSPPSTQHSRQGWPETCSEKVPFWLCGGGAGRAGVGVRGAQGQNSGEWCSVHP